MSAARVLSARELPVALTEVETPVGIGEMKDLAAVQVTLGPVPASAIEFSSPEVEAEPEASRARLAELVEILRLPQAALVRAPEEVEAVKLWVVSGVHPMAEALQQAAHSGQVEPGEPAGMQAAAVAAAAGMAVVAEVPMMTPAVLMGAAEAEAPHTQPQTCLPISCMRRGFTQEPGR